MLFLPLCDFMSGYRMKFTLTLPWFYPVSNIPSMLQTHLHLHVFLARSTNGRSLDTSGKQRSFGNMRKLVTRELQFFKPLNLVPQIRQLVATLSLRRLPFDSWPFRIEFVPKNVVLGQACLRILSIFSCQYDSKITPCLFLFTR